MMAIQIQDDVTVARTKRYTALDLARRGKRLMSRTRPVRMLARAPMMAVRNDARARERTVK
jgi:hypothetical protein